MDADDGNVCKNADLETTSRFFGDHRRLCPIAYDFAFLSLVALTEASRISSARIAAPHSFSEGIGARPTPGAPATTIRFQGVLFVRDVDGLDSRGAA